MKCSLVFMPVWGSDAPPLSLAYLKAVLLQKQIDCETFDFAVQIKNNNLATGGDSDTQKSILARPELLEAWADEILASRADVIGFSVTETNLKLTVELAKLLKSKSPLLPIIAGGPTFVPQMKSHIQIALRAADYVIQGDGEIILPEILKSIHDPSLMRSLKQIWYLSENKEPVYTGDAPRVEMDSLPYPDFDGVDFSIYKSPDLFPIMFSRGCILNCNFCTNKWNDKTQRTRSAKHVYGELVRNIERYGAKRFIFNDDSLISHVTLQPLKEFCEMAIAGGHVIPWSIYGTRIERMLTPEYVGLLAKAGLKDVMLGVESFSSSVQKHMGKSSDYELTDRVIRMFHDAGVKVKIYLIYGYPTETEEDFNTTLQWLVENGHLLSVASVHPFMVNKRFNEARPEAVESYGKRNWAWRTEVSDLEKRKKRFLRMVEVLETLRTKNQFEFRIAEPFAKRYFRDWNDEHKHRVKEEWMVIEKEMALSYFPMKISKDLLNSKHFCILPWVHARIETTGKVSPCCRIADDYTYGDLKEQKLDEIWNDSKIGKMRLDLLQNKELPQCRSCTRAEGPGFPMSHRQLHNKMFSDAFDKVEKTRPDGSIASNELLFLDLRFSNLCNFRCRTCVPNASSAWYQDSNLMNPSDQWKEIIRPTQNREELWSILEAQIPHLRKIYFAGGEPLLEEDHYLLLENLLKKGRTDVILSYNSNLSTLQLKNWNVLDLWPKFREVNVYASFDGVGSHGELFRKGTRWSKLEQNFEALRKVIPKNRLKILTTVSAMNAFHLPKAIDHWIDLGWITQAHDIQFNLVMRPERINLSILTTKERELLGKVYAEYISSLESRKMNPALFNHLKNQFQSVLNSFSETVWEKQRSEFRSWTLKLDKIRNENFLEMVPELSEVFEAPNASS